MTSATVLANLAGMLASGGVEVVDCTGVFKTAAKIAPYYAAGVKKVIVSHPARSQVSGMQSTMKVAVLSSN